VTDPPPTPAAPPSAQVRSALPSQAARAAAFAAVVVAGVCGAFIGYAFADLQCEGDCTAQTGAAAVVGGGVAAAGVAVVVVLVLRAMGEWRTIREREGPAITERNRPPASRTHRPRPRVQ
jgi:hypothetical protein